MLQESLEPLIKQVEGQEWEDALKITREWFAAHPEDIAGEGSELSYLCELPNEIRMLVTYPVMGNLVLARLRGFQPRNDYQRMLLETAECIVEETRFHNHHHTREVKPMRLIQLETELTANMLGRTEDGAELQRYITDAITQPAVDVIDNLQQAAGKSYSSDFGHGLIAPLHDFTYHIVHEFGFRTEKNMWHNRPLDKASMVVDDTDPAYWHGLLKLAGFQEREGQPGYFRSGESALPALETGNYDIILTDLELGEGRMNGVQFAQRARKVQLARGKPAMIALFSYNLGGLRDAKSYGFHYPSSPDDLFFIQPDTNTKGHFSPFHFRFEVEYLLRI